MLQRGFKLHGITQDHFLFDSSAILSTCLLSPRSPEFRIVAETLDLMPAFLTGREWEGKVLKELPFKELFQQSHSTAICIVLFTYSCKGGLEFWSWNAENSQVFLRWEEGSWLLGRQSVSFDILAFNYGINEFRFVSSFFFGSHLHPFLIISWSLAISSAVWMGEGSNER